MHGYLLAWRGATCLFIMAVSDYQISLMANGSYKSKNIHIKASHHTQGCAFQTTPCFHDCAMGSLFSGTGGSYSSTCNNVPAKINNNVYECSALPPTLFTTLETEF
jgi:hypothetical protein